MDADITRLARDVELATGEYIEAKEESSAASSRTTAAINKLNQVQKSFDAALAELRKGAPRGSDWGQRGSTMASVKE